MDMNWDVEVDVEMVLTPRNIVATVNLECRLDLKTIALHARNAEYNPKVCLRPRFFYVDVLSLCYWTFGLPPLQLLVFTPDCRLVGVEIYPFFQGVVHRVLHPPSPRSIPHLSSPFIPFTRFDLYSLPPDQTLL
jgi:hypothetical protein